MTETVDVSKLLQNYLMSSVSQPGPTVRTNDKTAEEREEAIALLRAFFRNGTKAIVVTTLKYQTIQQFASLLVTPSHMELAEKRQAEQRNWVYKFESKELLLNGKHTDKVIFQSFNKRLRWMLDQLKNNKADILIK